MGVKLLDYTEDLKFCRTHKIFDDFDYFVSTDLWTSVLTDSGTASVSDGAKGILALVASDGTVADNDEAYVKSTKEVFLFANNKPLVAQALIQFTEANTDDANVFFGFVDAIAADTLVDNGAGLKTTMSGAAIYKVDGGTVWKCVSSLSTTQTISTSVTTAGGSSYQELRIEITPVSSTVAEVSFFVDDAPLKDSNGKVIKHNLTYTSATEMMVGAGVKNGSANNETLNIDYIYAAQLR